MKKIYALPLFILLVVGYTHSLLGQNQTDTVNPIYPETDLPFRLEIEQADFSLPNGIHSGVSAFYKDKWVFFAGRTNGMHGFDVPGDANFPPQQQNRVVYVVDPKKKTVISRSLDDSASGLTATQIDQLSVTSPQSYQEGEKLYVTGGYGVDSSNGLFSTKDTLTVLDIPDLIHWVTHPTSRQILSHSIKQLSDPIFKVTGGIMMKVGSKSPTLLVYGQNFQGFYVPFTSGTYTRQVRRFIIDDKGENLSVKILASRPSIPDPRYRRRDLNVCPTMKVRHGKSIKGLTAFSGVFTEAGGIWTVPVEITANGFSTTVNPNSPSAFKQGMNNYVCATVGLFSKKKQKMYVTFFGGLSFGFFENGVFQTDEEIPFINQVTTIQQNKEGLYRQHLMSAEYPVILSTQSNPGNQLLFGAGAYFMPASDAPAYSNLIVKLDSIGHKPLVIGYIVGGIQSTVPNTESITDSAASPYIFKVKLIPVK